MHQIIVRILDEIRGAWRFRWHGMAVAWAVCLLGWAYVIHIPDVFEASARVYVDTQSALRPLIKGLAVEPDVDSDLAVVRQALLSRPRLEQVARDTDLDIRAKTPEAMQSLIASLQQRLMISNDVRTANSTSDGVYRITFQDVNRDKTVQVVERLMNSFVEDTLGSKRTGQEDAQRFLREQISDYERRLSEAESRLADFKKRNVGMMPDDRGDYFARLQREMVGADQARQQLALADARRDELQRQLSGEEPFMFGIDDQSKPSANAGSGDLAVRIREMERREEELLLRYTEEWPEVVAVRATLADLRQKQEEELKRVRSGQRATGSLSQSLKSNPVYQGLRLEMNRAEVQVAELQKDISQRQARVTELQRLVNSVPEVEAELARLNRDYEVTRGQYQQLVQRLETAKLSEDAEKTGVVSFQIIDPPVAAFKPVAPNRPLLLSGILILALGSALAAAYLFNQLKPVFFNTRMLADIMGLPVLGAVSAAWVDRDKFQARKQWVAFGGATALLLTSFVATLFLHSVVAGVVGHVFR
jgi:polysaccharide chain length determinant protein (PEP-CTERM system associated)